MKNIREDIKKIKVVLESNFKKKEQEGASYKVMLSQVEELAAKIESRIQSNEDLPSWVQDKIVICHHNLDAIFNHIL